jgi:hypothetical protein
VSGKSRTFRGLLRLLIAEGWDVEQLLRSAIRLSSAGNMLTSAAVSLTSTCLAAAAERTTAMWTVSARLAAERRKRRDEFRLARSRCGRSQVRVVMRRRRQWRERARECSTPPEDSRDAGQAWSLHSLVRRWRAMSDIGT